VAAAISNGQHEVVWRKSEIVSASTKCYDALIRSACRDTRGYTAIFGE
jgi:hypothetical protein